MTSHEIAAAISTMELSELGQVLEVLVEKVHKHRLEHNGYVPPEIFAACLGIGGIYPCVEVIVRDTLAYYLLKKRDGKIGGTGLGGVVSDPRRSRQDYRQSRSHIYKTLM